MSISKLVDNFKTGNLLIVFGVLGIIWTIEVTIPTISLFEFGLNSIDILLLGIISAPIILLLAAAVSIFTKKLINTVFWFTFSYWSIISVGEMMEGKPYNPNFSSLVVILVLSILLVSAKFIYNKANQH